MKILLRHPERKVDDISKVLGVSPDRSWDVGEARVAPDGTPLPGLRRETVWSLNFRIEGANFGRKLEDVSKILGKRPDYFLEFVETGGRAMVVLNLPGQDNRGDEISPQVLDRLAKAKITLGIEVFPDMVDDL